MVNKHLTNLKALVNAANIDGIHNNDRASSFIVKKKVEDHEKAVEIYLTEAELQALYEMPLTGKNDHIRDVFLIGCYTSQRVSDYNNLNKDQFETTRKGNRVIRLIQQKTKTPVTIPILNGNVIVPRYDCVTTHTARRTGITNMYLSHKYTILQMMSVSGHKTQKTFMDYIKLTSKEIADEIADMAKKDNELW